MGRVIGFLGLGIMGFPMARNLAAAGHDLLVWNRSQPSLTALATEGAQAAASPAEVLSGAPITLMMLQNGEVIDAVLGRGTAVFARNLKDRTLVHMGTTAPSYSAGLERDVLAAGGRYAEVPVSGSRLPAEEGRLIAMAAGHAETLDDIEPLLAPMAASVIRCGPCPKATQMKLAVNTFLASQMLGLVEAIHLAEAADLDTDLFRQVLWNGPMASDLMRMKLPKLLERDLTPQASVDNSLDNLNLMLGAAEEVGTDLPLVRAGRAVMAETSDAGHGPADFVASILTLEARRTHNAD